MRLKGRTSLRVFGRVSSNLKCFDSCVVDDNVVGMTITTYRIMCDDYIRFKVADYFYNVLGNFV